jgi:hypothetical protein
MTDKELVKRLLDFEKVTVGDARDAALRIEALTAKVKLMDDLDVINGEKIEALTAKNEMLGREVNIARYGQPNFAWSVHVEVMADLNAKLAKAVELLKEARQDLEEYVTHEWPKDEHPVYERKWERDMELCRRIDATLAEIEGSDAP